MEHQPAPVKQDETAPATPAKWRRISGSMEKSWKWARFTARGLEGRIGRGEIELPAEVLVLIEEKLFMQILIFQPDHVGRPMV